MSVEKNDKTKTWSFRKRIKNSAGRIIYIRKSGYKTKKEAQFAEANYFFKKDEKRLITIKELSVEYLKYLEDKYKYSTIYGKRIMIEKYILPLYGEKYATQITNQDILNWHQILKRELPIPRINKIHCEFKLLLEYAEKFHSLKDNPPKIVGPIKDSNPKIITMQTWTPDEFNRFISKCDNETYYTLFNLLYYTGMRKGEALALKWADLNLSSKQVIITKTVSQKHDKNLCTTYMITAPKTLCGIRNIDLPNKLFDILLNYKNQEAQKYKELSPSDFIFGKNKPLSETPITVYKNKICKLAKVKQIRIHDFRHSHASLLINMGINPLFIKERLGHKDVSTTLDVYSHLFPTNQKEIIERLDNIIK